jgi:hypothetical protein
LPDTEQHLRRKIARLGAKRDRALKEARFRFWFGRAVAPVSFVFLTILLLAHLFSRRSSLAELLLSGAFAALSGYWARRVWSVEPPADDDPWSIPI